MDKVHQRHIPRIVVETRISLANGDGYEVPPPTIVVTIGGSSPAPTDADAWPTGGGCRQRRPRWPAWA
ncbi:hypothetical protein ThrDRAFT_03968 [Frankia casuarinae]|jgi:hypothetical protein|nr:hypothetical protein ThrDRAFT_03968 [Frankia casuarinae]KDA44888.1 hypothetical protein BMG523Draft_00012 [Frankia sp. BMG5.23]